jgi:hypothetical protein
VPAERRFLLDADVLISAHRLYYGFDICPGFWDFLVESVHQVQTIDKIRDELLRGDDDDLLKKWVSERPGAFIASTTDIETMRCAGEIFPWVQEHEQYLPSAKKEFAEAADGWLVAHAKAAGVVVVTREKSEPLSKKNVKIPDVCRKFGVEYIDTFALLRELSATFVLPPR